MPNISETPQPSSSGDDLGSSDEVKVFKDEGDREDETVSSENLLEEKSSLIDLTECADKSGETPLRSSNHSSAISKFEPHASDYNMSYLVSPYSYANGAGAGLSVSMANKIGLQCFLSRNGDHLSSPPPAHCGIPPYQLDAKSMAITRTSIYPFPSSQYPYTLISPEMSQVASWHSSSVYSAPSNFRRPYHTPLPGDLNADFSFRFSSNLIPNVHTSPYHAINSHIGIKPTNSKQSICKEGRLDSNFSRNLDSKPIKITQGKVKNNNVSIDKGKPHIKKPLNAFMLYMKEMRSKVVAECTLKESAAINQILGRRWHELSRDEQGKYYEKARQERQLHMELYPGWSARDNYGYVSKKKKRKRDKFPVDSEKLNTKSVE